jgi:hypothetical protein
VQATMYGAHISHSGAAGIPAQKGLAVLWTSRISARATLNFGLWKNGSRPGCWTRWICNTFFDTLQTAPAGSGPYPVIMSRMVRISTGLERMLWDDQQNSPPMVQGPVEVPGGLFQIQGCGLARAAVGPGSPSDE